VEVLEHFKQYRREIMADTPNLDRFWRSAEGKRILDADAALELAEREKLVGKAEKLRGERATGLPPLQTAVTKATAEENAARQTFEAKREARVREESARTAHAAKYESAIAQVEAELRRTCPFAPTIDAYIAAKHEQHERERRAPARSEERATGEYYRTDGRPVVKYFTTRHAVVRRLQRLLEVAALADELKLEALDEAELAQKLAQLEASIPTVMLEPELE
jgi:hypothetical protein